jgi:hypothetical protein
MNDSHKDFEKMLMEFYQKGFADCEAAAKKAIEHGIRHAILLEREACAKLCDDIDTPDGWSTASLSASIRARGNK